MLWKINSLSETFFNDDVFVCPNFLPTRRANIRYYLSIQSFKMQYTVPPTKKLHDGYVV